METTYLNESKVLVTSTRIVAGGQTYVLNGITSVRIVIESAPVAAPAILFISAIVLFALAFSAKSFGAGTLGLLSAIGGYFTTKASTPTYALVLRTASGEVRAVIDKDRNRLQRIHDAITAAIVARR